VSPLKRAKRKVRFVCALGPIAACSRCGWKTREGNLALHELRALCFVRCVSQCYREMGWVQAGAYGRVLVAAGLDAELAPTGITQVAIVDAPEPWRSRVTKKWAATRTWTDIPRDAWWAPARSVHLAKLLVLVRLGTAVRVEAVRQMARDPELSEAVASARLFGGPEAVRVLLVGVLPKTKGRRKVA
jgi:hypothetical protein